MAVAIKMMTVKQVVDKKIELENRDSARNNSYDEVLTFYGGDTYRNIKKKGFIAGVTQALSSIFSPKDQDEGAELRTPINLVKPAIENKVAFLAIPPTVRVIEPPDILAPMQGTQPGIGLAPNTPADVAPPPPAMPGAPAMPPATPQLPASPGGAPVPAAPGNTGEDWATDFADRLENVLASLLAQSNMPKRCRDAAWSLCAMDGAILGVWPDIRHGRPRFFTRTPQDFYPVAYDPDGLELSLALWVDTITGNDVVARYPDLAQKYAGRPEVEVIQCIDEGFFYTVLDAKEWAHEPMENKTGIVPIVCVGSLGLPGMIFGSTDIKDAIPVAKEINYHMYLIDEMASATIRPTIAVKDPINVPEEIAIGRGGLITMGPNGSVELLGPLNLPNAFWQLGQTLNQWFDLISDNPEVLRSADSGGSTSGKGFNARLGPVAARMQTRLDILMAGWRQVMKYALLMWANFPGMKPVKTTGVKLKETFYISAEPSEFMIEGEIWTELEVFLEAQSYIDRQGSVVELMQLYQNELIDWDTAVDNLPQVTDKRRTRLRIDKDRQWKAKGMAIAQQAANSATTANAPLADQQLTNYKLERGFMGETGAMPGPTAEGAPPPQEAPMNPAEGAPPAGDSAGSVIAVLQEFFQSIPKLLGGVWFGGDPILSPDKLAGENWTVDVWITNPQDKGTITRAAQNVEIIYGHLRFHNGQPDPEEKAIQVSNGESITQTETIPQEGPPPEGAMPEEAEAAMGGMV